MLHLSESCSDVSSVTWGFFDFSIAPALLFYSYVPIMLLSILFGLFIFFHDRFSLRSKLFLGISITFFVLLLNEILQWVAVPVSLVMFGWELVPLLRVLVAVLTLYFVFAFIRRRDLDFFSKLILSSFILFVTILLPTELNIKYFDIDNCEGVPGWLWFAGHIVVLLCVFAIGFITFVFGKDKNNLTNKDLRQNKLVGIGGILFLLIFFSSTIWGDFTTIYDVALLGPVGMLMFIISITFIIVKYHAFNIKLAAPISLVFAMWMLVFSLLFVHDINHVTVIVGMTLILLTLVGFALIESVRNDIRSREQIEKLVNDLAKANTRLKELDKQKSEFVSIASHQLRSPLTAISGYASLLQEGSYGKLPAKAIEPIERIYTSARAMTQSVEEYLNVSRIESGNMKYNLTDFNLHTEVEHVCDDLRPIALKKGLLLFFRTDLTSRSTVNADKGKIVQAVHNLINNAIKYTEKGTITVLLHDDVNRKKIFVEVIDSGIGMSDETLSIIFNKFKRAENAHRVNIQGTGLGLYMALKIVEAMGGTISAHSEGEGKGSKFVIELPLIG